MERFWSKVKKGPGCWEWTAQVDVNGYGRFRFRGRTWGAHRVAWTLARGDIPTGLCVLHHCDNPKCCRPDHLFPGTQADNVADMGRKGRQGERNRGEKHGRAKLTERDIKIIRRLYKPGRVTQKQLANMFGVSKQQISRIVIRELWKHIG